MYLCVCIYIYVCVVKTELTNARPYRCIKHETISETHTEEGVREKRTLDCTLTASTLKSRSVYLCLFQNQTLAVDCGNRAGNFDQQEMYITRGCKKKDLSPVFFSLHSSSFIPLAPFSPSDLKSLFAWYSCS